jgi:hypothetical protein
MLNDKFLLEMSGKGQNGNYEKRISDLIDSEKKLNEYITRLRTEHD